MAANLCGASVAACCFCILRFPSLEFPAGYCFSHLAPKLEFAASYFFSNLASEPESCCRLLFLTYCYKYAANPGFCALFYGTPSSAASRQLLVKCSTNAGFALETAFFSDISGTVLSEAFFYIIATPYGDPPRKPGFSRFS